MTIARFWREIPSRYRLEGTKCQVCGRVYLPSRSICPVCHRKSIGKMEKISLSGRGKVVEYTIIHDPHPDFSLQVPYVMGIIEMEEGVRLTGQIVDTPIDEIHEGMDVEAVFRKINMDGPDGLIHYGYKFTKAIEPK